MLTKKLSILLLSLFLALTACKDKTEKYVPINNSDSTPNVETSTKKMPSFKDDVHTVTVNKVLKTKRYLYINVTAKNNIKPYWIATRIMDVKVGQTYFYKGGLLKTNFESKEFKKVFDKIYLVSSNLVPANHAMNPGFKLNKTTQVPAQTSKPVTKTKSTNIKPIKGSISIANLVKNAKKYAGKTVQISGLCTKINGGIMDRNWIHLVDGSKDDFDLVITSNEIVKVGQQVTIKAIVTLNKDFGAGYKYDLILEEGAIVK